jgi:hypothetical protein
MIITVIFIILGAGPLYSEKWPAFIWDDSLIDGVWHSATDADGYRRIKRWDKDQYCDFLDPSTYERVESFIESANHWQTNIVPA